MLVGKAAVELGGEFEVLKAGQLLDPDAGNFGPERAVKRGVDLDGGEVLGEIGGLMETVRAVRRVNGAAPVVMRPASRTDPDIGL